MSDTPTPKHEHRMTLLDVTDFPNLSEAEQLKMVENLLRMIAPLPPPPATGNTSSTR